MSIRNRSGKLMSCELSKWSTRLLETANAESREVLVNTGSSTFGIFLRQGCKGKLIEIMVSDLRDRDHSNFIIVSIERFKSHILCSFIR